MYLLYIALFILNVLMTIDGALNRRSISWFFIIWCIPLLGSIIYIIYNRSFITFPFSAGSFSLSSPRGGKVGRCMRCGRHGQRLYEFEDCRRLNFFCKMCIAEIELLRKL
jgi:hypothetical protein